MLVVVGSRSRTREVAIPLYDFHLRLHLLMASARDHVELLLARQINEFDRVARHADREVCILRLLGMLHRVNQLLRPEDVDVQVMRTLLEVTVQD